MSRSGHPVLVVLLLTALFAAPASAQDTEGDELSSRLGMLSSGELRDASPAEQADAVSLLSHGAGSLMRSGGDLVVEIRVADQAYSRVDSLRDAGARILHVSAEYRTITAAVPEGRLLAVAAVAGVDAVTEVITPMTGSSGDGVARPSAGAINACAPGTISEGDVQLKAATARTQFDVDGTGVKVGVLSDSFDRAAGATKHAADDVASADLPGAGNPCSRSTPVQLVDDSAVGADEGRAMAQIVHDVAPGAQLAFATAFVSETSFADNIRALATAGSDVIVDDVIYANEPMYQDGAIANAVSDVTAQGVTYFSMAFNNNRVIAGNDSNSWEAPAFRPTACPATVPAGSCMDFDPGAGVDTSFQLTAPGGKAFRIALQWAEPQLGVGTDLDLYVRNTATSTNFSSVDVNATTGRPFEFVSFTAGNTTALNYQIIIRRSSGSGTPRLKWVNSDNGAGSISALEYPTSSLGDVIGPTIYGHNGAANAQTVAAVPFNNSATPEAFSSRGPVTKLFAPVNGVSPAAPLAAAQVLNKPDVAATDGGINTFFGGGNRFFGTSAAAPHAAGVGALQLSANPALTQQQVKAAQVATASPVGTFGQLAVGAGLVNAQAAIAANPTTAPTTAILSRPPARSNNIQPSFSFNSVGRLKSTTCILDGASAPCASPYTVPAPLADGSHTLTIRATDFFDQNGDAAATFEVDTTGPGIDVQKGPKSKSTKKKAKFKFSAEPESTFECKLDRAMFSACESPAKFKVKPGKHELQIQAIDSLGNAGEAETYKWKYKKKKRRK